MFHSVAIFWFAYSGLFAIITICTWLNSNLYKHLEILISWIKDTFRPALLDTGHVTEARDIQVERLPVLENWTQAAIWYGIITFGLQVLMLLLGAFAHFSTGIPYILLMVIVMLLGSMVMFFPRTLIRWLNVKKAIGFYFFAYVNLMKIKELTEKSNDGDSIRTDSHS